MSWLSEGMPKLGRRASPNPASHRTTPAGSISRVQRPPGRAEGNCQPVRARRLCHQPDHHHYGAGRPARGGQPEFLRPAVQSTERRPRQEQGGRDHPRPVTRGGDGRTELAAYAARRCMGSPMTPFTRLIGPHFQTSRWPSHRLIPLPAPETFRNGTTWRQDLKAKRSLTGLPWCTSLPPPLSRRPVRPLTQG